MAKYILTQLAEQDVENIAQYSLEKFGLQQAEKYIVGLHQALDTLIEYPTMGSSQHHIKIIGVCAINPINGFQYR